FAYISRQRTDEGIVLILFHDVRSPAGNARHDEDWREELNWEAEDVIRRARWEVQVRLDLAGGIFLHRLSQDVVDFYPFCLAMRFCHFLGCRSHGWRARIALFVDTVTNAHYQVLVAALFCRPRCSFRWPVERPHLVNAGLAGTTGQRALERADSSHNWRVA